MLTKKHFQQVAVILSKHRLPSKWDQEYKALCWDMAGFLARQNPRFDRERFLTACGLPHKPCPACGDSGKRYSLYFDGYITKRERLQRCPDCCGTGAVAEAG